MALAAVLGLAACQSRPPADRDRAGPEPAATTGESAAPGGGRSAIAVPRPTPAARPAAAATLLERLDRAERSASPGGRAVLATGRQMTLVEREILPGGCWDYANEVYNRAGHPGRGGRRSVFKGSKERGPYATPAQIRPGDFLYYINHSYGDIEHSAIFVAWLDIDSRRALMLSYAGEQRREPARYKSYDLSHVYRIVRPVE